MDNFQEGVDEDHLQLQADDELLRQLQYLAPPPPMEQQQQTSSAIPELVDWASLLLPMGSGGAGTSQPVAAAGVGEEGMVSSGAVAAAETGGSSSTGAGVSGDQQVIKERKGGGARGRKATKPRFAFQTKSENDVLDDGYRWRKYGQKAVKNSAFPRYVYLLLTVANLWYVAGNYHVIDVCIYASKLTCCATLLCVDRTYVVCSVLCIARRTGLATNGCR